MKKIIILLSVIGLTMITGTAASGGDRFLGVNGTAGAALSYYRNPDYYTVGYRPAVKVGVDCAYSIGSRFALGFYTSVGGGPVFSERVTRADKDTYHNGTVPGFDLKVGILALVGDLSDRPFIIGLAPGTGFGMCNPAIYLPVEVRFGRMLGSRLYITGNLGTGTSLAYNDGTEVYLFLEPSISVGFNFGPRKRSRR